MPGLKALLVDLDFQEAHFKVHFTETTRISYPIPLPPSVAGIFGAMLGWRRLGYPAGLLCGAKLSGGLKPFIEAVTYHQLGLDIWLKGVASAEVLSEPSYAVAIACDDTVKLNEWWSRLSAEEYEYLPYGGQNDFFVKDIKAARLSNVIYTDVVEGYAPSSWVKEFITRGKETTVTMLPVSYKPKPRELFAFPVGGAKLRLNRSVPTVEGIPLYPLDDFFVVIG